MSMRLHTVQPHTYVRVYKLHTSASRCRTDLYSGRHVERCHAASDGMCVVDISGHGTGLGAEVASPGPARRHAAVPAADASCDPRATATLERAASHRLQCCCPRQQTSHLGASKEGEGGLPSREVRQNGCDHLHACSSEVSRSLLVRVDLHAVIADLHLRWYAGHCHTLGDRAGSAADNTGWILYVVCAAC